MVITGLERVVADPHLLSAAGKFALLYNQASVDRQFRTAPEVIHEAFPERLVALFGPQHGFAGTEQDNMNETDHAMHPRLGIPVYSLYSRTRRPAPAWLENVDAVLVEACREQGKPVIILDRPNPINGIDVEGNLLDPQFASFVGPLPIPMRHGLTLGELMSLYNAEYGIGSNLTVIPMLGWKRGFYFEETELPWVLPSPNMPLVETAIVYPGQVVLEGTNLSEGRGTTRPFEMFGAPYVQTDVVAKAVEEDALTGAVLRETEFRPTFNKWAGDICRGFQIHVVRRSSFRPFRATMALLSAMIKLFPEHFRWTDPPYEYVADKLPVDVILGDVKVRRDLEQGRSIRDLEDSWKRELEQFTEMRSEYFLYPF